MFDLGFDQIIHARFDNCFTIMGESGALCACTFSSSYPFQHHMMPTLQGFILGADSIQYMQEWLDRYDERDWQAGESGTVRFALIGLGWWTIDVALPAIKSSDFGAVSTLVSSSTEKAKRYASEYGVDRGISYDEFHDGGASDSYEAVYIATPNARHLDFVESAARLEKAVLCEKPVEATVERAEKLVRECERVGIPLMVAYRMHFDPAVRRARELVKSGFLGRPVNAHGRNSQSLLEIIPDEEQWRLDPDLTGYGTSMMDLGIYSINTTRFLLRREPTTVQAQMSSHHEAFENVPDESATALLTFDGGVTLTTNACQNAQEDTQLTIIGTEGLIELRPAFHGKCSLRLSRGDVSATIEYDDSDVEFEMKEMVDYFADRVLREARIHADGRHALEDIRIIRAVHEAAECGNKVKL